MLTNLEVLLYKISRSRGGNGRSGDLFTLKNYVNFVSDTWPEGTTACLPNRN
jgi:hypothetical protein